MKIQLNDIRFSGDPAVSVFADCENSVVSDEATGIENACSIKPSFFNECDEGCPKLPRLVYSGLSSDNKTAVIVKSTGSIDYRTREVVFPILRIALNIINTSVNNKAPVHFICACCDKTARFIPDLLIYRGWRTDGKKIYCPTCSALLGGAIYRLQGRNNDR